MAGDTKTKRMVNPNSPSPNLDDALLDIVTAIELSDRDRQVAENRYRRLKEHLERPSSPFARYLSGDDTHIYPQGSMAIGATVVNGTDHDRFDLDALVETVMPKGMTPDEVLDELYDALVDFPDAVKVVRCTRCVQIQFAFMHMDVTVLDPTIGQDIDRAGEIFHSPDKGPSYRVPANPYGFSAWFRSTVPPAPQALIEEVMKRRDKNGVTRLMKTESEMLAEAEQHDLPAIIPPRLDSEQVLALKLLKRFLSLAYEDREMRRPPSIYITKLAADIGLSSHGLCAQLLMLAGKIRAEMLTYLAVGGKPDERNPSYTDDRLNDRWPMNRQDMEVLAQDMQKLTLKVEAAKNAEFKDTAKIFSELFGEKISERSIKMYLERAMITDESGAGNYIREAALFIPATTIAAPAIAKSVSPVPQHHFHSEIIKDKL